MSTRFWDKKLTTAVTGEDRASQIEVRSLAQAGVLLQQWRSTDMLLTTKCSLFGKTNSVILGQFRKQGKEERCQIKELSCIVKLIIDRDQITFIQVPITEIQSTELYELCHQTLYLSIGHSWPMRHSICITSTPPIYVL